MSLALTEEQAMLRDSARAFLNDNAPVAHLRAMRDQRAPDGFSRDVWRRFSALGFGGTLVPEAHGGLGLTAVEAGVIAEAIGHTLTPMPYLSSAVLAATLIAQAGSDAQRATWLPRIADGSLLATLALDETAKHRPHHVALSARQQADGWQLSGQKTFVVDGHVAELMIVVARTHGAAGDTDGISLFAVDSTAPGIAVERTLMVDAHNAARVVFDAVSVAPDALLGPAGAGAGALDRALDVARCVVAGELLGIADEVFERTVRYLSDRKQFGTPIGSFQALQHRAADLYCEIEIARAVTLRAQQSQGTPEGALLASAAKAKAGDVATRAVQEGVQMHGGIGMTDEFEMGFFMKRARVLQELFGDAGFHADRFASLHHY